MKKRNLSITKLLLAAAVVTALTAASASFAAAEESAAQTKPSDAPVLPTKDRAGNAIVIPEEITKVVSMAPAATQILEELGLKDLLVAVDTQTPLYVEGTQELPQFDMMTPDCEYLLALDPDIVFVSGMSYYGADNPYSELITAGICVAEIPSSESLAAIQEDIQFISDCFGMHEEGAAIVTDMQTRMDAVSAIGQTIAEPKSVLFEIACLPYIYSFGNGVFLDEMLQMIGAENVFADQDSWISVTEEAAVASNPDVILTSVHYIEDSVGEILGREGWENVEAVKNQQVFYIDNTASSQPNHHVVDALEQMALAVYPEEYAALGE